MDSSGTTHRRRNRIRALFSFRRQSSPASPPPVPTTTNLVQELESLDDFFEDEQAAQTVQEVPSSITRRISVTVRGMIDQRLRTPRNRDGIVPPESPLSLLCVPSRSSGPASQNAQSSSPPSINGPLESIPSPPPLPANRSLHLLPRPPTPTPTPIRSDSFSGLSGTRRLAHQRSMYVDEMTRDERRTRRATWAPDQASISIPRPISPDHGEADLPARGVTNASNDTEDLISINRVATTPPIRRPSSQYFPSITGNLANPSPLTSISSLFSRTTSNTSTPSTVASSSRDGPGPSAILRAGAARFATRTPSSIIDDEGDLSNFDQMRARNMRRLGRLSRARSRLRRELDTLRARQRDDDQLDISEIHRIVRGLGRRGSRGLNSDDDAERVDGMAPFTIVGIRRVDANGEGMEDDFLPPYLRDLVDNAPHARPGSAGDDDRHDRPRTFRQRRQRRVLSFYDRMEFQSREAVGRLQRSRPRSMYGAGSLRRNGVVEPDSPAADDEAPRHETYVIYLISGVLPENHPLLATPSLFTENPSYEDMLLIASLLGPAKPPVATETEVSSAGGLFDIQIESVENGKDKLFAMAQQGDERIALPPVLEDGVERAERCLICLSDFEIDDEARKLVKCGHLFHKDCIGHWLTEGRNSCPLCRGEGVDKKATV